MSLLQVILFTAHLVFLGVAINYHRMALTATVSYGGNQREESSRVFKDNSYLYFGLSALSIFFYSIYPWFINFIS